MFIFYHSIVRLSRAEVDLSHSKTSSQINILSQKWNSRHDDYIFGFVFVIHCHFIHCRTYLAHGGAILSLCPTTVLSSVFSICDSKTGGGLCVFANLTVSHTSFNRNSASFGGGAATQFENSSITFTTFWFCTSGTLAGAFWTQSNFLFWIYSNITYCCAVDSAAGIFQSSESSTIRCSIFAFCGHNDRGASITISKVIYFEVSDSIFSKLKATSISVGFGISALLIKAPSHGNLSVSKCVFYECSNQQQRYFSISRQSSSILIFDGCAFSHSKRQEFSGLNGIIFNSNNHFEVQKFEKSDIPKYQWMILPIPNRPSVPFIRSAVLKLQTIIRTALLLSIFTFIMIAISFTILRRIQKK
jgi:hypothetical protein